MKTIGMLLLAGQSTRFDNKKSKQVFLLKGKPVFSYSLLALAKSKYINHLLVVVNKEIKNEVVKFLMTNRIKATVVLGGKTRQESVENGLKSVKLAANDVVIIHDGARPLVDNRDIKEVLKGAKKCGASSLFIPETDTVAMIEKGNFTTKFVNRNLVAKIQTPQAFKFSVLAEAHKKAKDKNATDDCSLVTNLGYKVKLVLGSKKLTKITTIEDAKFIEGLVK